MENKIKKLKNCLYIAVNSDVADELEEEPLIKVQ